MNTIAELKSMRHLDTDLVKVARLIPAHRAGIIMCDEEYVYIYTTAGNFSVEWIDWEYGGKTNHAATAAAIEKGFIEGHHRRPANAAKGDAG